MDDNISKLQFICNFFYLIIFFDKKVYCKIKDVNIIFK